MNIIRIIATTLVASACLLPGFANADVSEATFTPQGNETYRALNPAQVVIYVYKPDFKFKIIGIIEAHGMAGGDNSILGQLDILGRLLSTPPTEKDDILLAMKALKEEAAAAGAEGVLILQSTQVRVSQNATERQIRAVAIRRAE